MVHHPQARVGQGRLQVARRRQGVRGVVAGLLGRDESAHGLVHDRALGSLGRREQAGDYAPARPGDAGRLAQRPPRVAGELERVDADHRVEHGVTERQGLHVAVAQVGPGQPLAGDTQQARADVQAAGHRTAPGGQLEREPRAAPHIEQAGTRAGVRRVEHRLEQRLVVRLGQVRPGPRVGAPQPALDLRGGADRRDVLVEPEDVVRVVGRLDPLQALDRAPVGAGRALVLVVAHEVDVRPPAQKRLDRGVGRARPGDLARVVGSVTPGGGDIDQPAGVPEAERRRLGVHPRDRAAQGQQFHLRDGRPERGGPLEQHVDEPAGQVAGEAGLDVGAQAMAE